MLAALARTPRKQSASDSLNNVWFGGTTSSATGFPFSPDAYPQPGGFSFNLMTPYLAQMSNDGKNIPFATPLASESGQLTSITVDNHDNIFVAGFSSVVPITPGVYPPVPEEFEPGFVQKWNAGPQPVLQLSSTFLSFPDTAIGGLSPSQTATITNTGLGAMELFAAACSLSKEFFPACWPVISSKPIIAARHWRQWLRARSPPRSRLRLRTSFAWKIRTAPPDRAPRKSSSPRMLPVRLRQFHWPGIRAAERFFPRRQIQLIFHLKRRELPVRR